ncbi:N-formylglutamate amidohydrolase [Yersinia enterocolitica]|uniref:N-formylglutamate amidohydrolase n=1 Tax=Yersinia enterocolitica TaxID=630 RepID=UPI0005E39D74|nr:N-formylglutamate amidohydrolase [Yersinia enterocolitica]EKN3573295.1 N-formylglutamate amidohydrolase [Yersinia enterocolitica]EKN3577169.1 N-formylglutamate amidohydrolase [Yersinia enterocolitica]EKN3683840.1 N-formylglutamate amidohydrolase [Yersinia enterocolitica]EKN3870475.1 N-formylglutamate amidohydrolase [Yersinia enterocolitica]EKN4017699.1 N-formylglutamate amidohydrolase [Yersinia enterocolitica]
MSNFTSYPLLRENEPPAAAIERAESRSPFILLADHAGQRIPAQLGDLGLPAGEIDRHIGWDIGSLATAQLLSQYLDATLIHQRYSRLVIDCNRTPGIASSIPELSENTRIPRNIGVTVEEAQARRAEVFQPYHDLIAQTLNQRRDSGQPGVIISMHSFTPSFKNISRPWQIGTLFHRNPEFALQLVSFLQQEDALNVGINEPYAMTDATDFTLPFHAEQRQLPYVGIEIRQDLITDENGQEEWARRLARLLPQVLSTYTCHTSSCRCVGYTQ